MPQHSAVRRSLLRVVLVEMVSCLPLDGGFVALVHVARVTDTRSKGVQFALHSMPLGVRVRAQLGFG